MGMRMRMRELRTDEYRELTCYGNVFGEFKAHTGSLEYKHTGSCCGKIPRLHTKHRVVTLAAVLQVDTGPICGLGVRLRALMAARWRNRR